MTRVHLDFETYSEADIKTVGGVKYVEDPTTEILCLAYKVDDGPTKLIDLPTLQIVDEANTVGADVSNEWSELESLASNDKALFVAHNAAFEQDVWRHLMRYLAMPPIPIERWVCTMAKALAHGLPGSLDGVSKALHLEARKDLDGKKIMLQCSKPRKVTKTNKELRYTPENSPEMFFKLYEYCKQDVEVEYQVDKCLRDLSPREKLIWNMDQRINQEGVLIDIPVIQKAIQFIEIQKADDLMDFSMATGGELESPGQTKALLPWLNAQGLDLRNLQKATLEAVIESGTLPPDLQDVLELRSSATKSSLAKYYKMMEMESDGKLRAMLRYHGAHTGRWTGSGVQLQNLVRPMVDIPNTIENLIAMDFEMFRWTYGNVNMALSSIVRGAIVPPRGYRFLIADFSQIESRVLAWLVGAFRKLQVFRDRVDVYCYNAERIYGYPVTPDMKAERQTGKVSELALGYQGGIGAYVKMASQSRVDLMKVFGPIWDSASQEEKDNAMFSDLLYRKKTEYPARKEVALVSDVIKQRWRAANPEIVKFWADLEITSIEAVKTKVPVKCGRVTWFVHDRFLYCKLPSGRCMAYPYPEVKRDGKGKEKLSYVGSKGKEYVYGGKLAENITQAVSRDLLADAMLRVEQNYPICLHVHDEMISQMPIGSGSLEEFYQLMSMLEPWAEGIPIDVSGSEGFRYGK